MLPDKEDAMEFKHKSIMLAETIESLHIKPDGIYVDGTLGGGGHSLEIAKRLTDGGRLIGIDQDADAIAAATIGGVSTTGGVGTVPGILVGVLVFELMKVALQFMNVNSSYTYIVQGLVIILAVAIDIRKYLAKK